MGKLDNTLLMLVILGVGSWLISSHTGLWLIVGCVMISRVAWSLLTAHGTVLILTKELAERLQQKKDRQ